MKRTAAKINFRHIFNYVIIAVVVASLFYLLSRPYYIKKEEAFSRSISELLTSYSVNEDSTTIIREYPLPKRIDIEGFKRRLALTAENKGFKLLKYRRVYQEGKAAHLFELGRDKKALLILKLLEKETAPAIVYIRHKKSLAKVAIVIDDWGYNTRNTALLDSIDIPITISILPNLAFSTPIAKDQSSRSNREVILHMPMEPEGTRARMEKDTLLSSLDKNKVITLLDTSFKSVPYAKGLSNHMGSKATQDRPLMAAVMEELNQKNFYFLDSLATPKSICANEAKRLNVRFLKRDIFLDNKSEREYISSQFDMLITLARLKGYAVGIGHDRQLTLEVIKEKVREVNDSNIKFVLASELAKR
jgi:polysaccharide deacetylase 2 family uncharacterized protein YibQ